MTPLHIMRTNTIEHVFHGASCCCCLAYRASTLSVHKSVSAAYCSSMHCLRCLQERPGILACRPVVHDSTLRPIYALSLCGQCRFVLSTFYEEPAARLLRE